MVRDGTFVRPLGEDPCNRTAHLYAFQIHSVSPSEIRQPGGVPVEFVPPIPVCAVDPSLVAKVVRVVSRRNGLRRDDAADLESNVWLKLLNHEQRVLKSFADRCSLFHFLKVVTTRVLLDMRAASLGKWRPSPAARRAGGELVQLERLVHRDGLAAQSAIRATELRTGISARDLELHLAQVAPRRRPRPVALDEDMMAGLPIPASAPMRA